MRRERRRKLTGLQIVVCEHELSVGQARLALNSELVDQPRDFGVLDFFHDG